MKTIIFVDSLDDFFEHQNRSSCVRTTAKTIEEFFGKKFEEVFGKYIEKSDLVRLPLIHKQSIYKIKFIFF